MFIIVKIDNEKDSFRLRFSKDKILDKINKLKIKRISIKKKLYISSSLIFFLIKIKYFQKHVWVWLFYKFRLVKTYIEDTILLILNQD